MEKEFKLIGKSLPKVDSLAKATGQAQYASDLCFPGMLYCKLLRSPMAHAKIVSIDASEVLAYSGVVDVLLGKDIPIPFGLRPSNEEENALAIDKVLYVGDPVAAVIAVDEATAEEALDFFQVEYQSLPAYMNIEEALQSTGELIHHKYKGNIHKEIALEFGDTEKGFKEADYIRDDLFFYSSSNHMTLEEHSSVAVPEDQDHITLYTPNHSPHYVRQILAKVLGKQPGHVRIVNPTFGGSFGAKGEPFNHELVVAYAADKLGRPVKYTMTREEVFYTHRGRHAVLMAVKTGVKNDGTITAMQFTNFMDGGAQGSLGVASSYYTGALQTVTYKIPNYRFEAIRYFTNKPPGGAKRGHGTPQPRFALEVQLDKIAEDLGISPIDIRKINAVEANSITVNYLRVTSCGLSECMERLEQASGFNSKRLTLPFGKGIGFAVSGYICGAGLPIRWSHMDHSHVVLKADRVGLVTLYSGSTDVGQGSRTVHASLVAEVLGLRQEDIYLVTGDTSLGPVDLGAYSSRETFMSGNAALQAAYEMRKMLAVAVSEKLQVPCENLVFQKGIVMDKDNPEKQLPFIQACILAEARFGILIARGSYRPKIVTGPYRGSGVGPSPAYSYSAAVVEVDCDVETGFIKVEKVYIAHDVGRALNRLSVIGQLEGSVYMGLGEALMEEQVMRGQRVKAPSMLDYKTLTSLDMPPVECIIIEQHDADGPFGAKEVGQGPILPIMPALANAVHNAIGIRIDEVPITPDKVRKALEDKAKGGLGRYGKTTIPAYSFSELERVARPWDVPDRQKAPFTE